MARSRSNLARKPRKKSKKSTPQKRHRTVPQFAFSVDQFCNSHNISRDLFYELLKLGLGPECMRLGKRRLISFEAAARWRHAREATEVAA